MDISTRLNEKKEDKSDRVHKTPNIKSEIGSIATNSSKEEVAVWIAQVEDGLFREHVETYGKYNGRQMLEFSKETFQKRCGLEDGELLYNALHQPQTGVGDASKSILERFTLLVKSADPHLEVNPHIIERCLKHYFEKAEGSIRYKDMEFALSLYYDTAALPQTETQIQLGLKGYEVNGPLIRGNESLLICFRDTRPCILKTLSIKEAQRIQHLPKLESRHIVPYLLEKSARSLLMIMPLLPTTLEHIRKLSLGASEKLWTQMSDALKCLHSHKIAHMDIKPSNICLNSNGDFILIDLGSVVQFGQKSDSTKAYIPKGLDTQVACAEVDWWMLAATLGERGCGMDEWGSGPGNPTKDQLLSRLEKLPFSTQIIKQLDPHRKWTWSAIASPVKVDPSVSTTTKSQSVGRVLFQK